MVDERNFSPNAIRALNTFCLLKQDLPWLMNYCCAGGGLVRRHGTVSEVIGEATENAGKTLLAHLMGW
jgi:hypothetical protein